MLNVAAASTPERGHRPVAAADYSPKRLDRVELAALAFLRLPWAAPTHFADQKHRDQYKAVGYVDRETTIAADLQIQVSAAEEPLLNASRTTAEDPNQQVLHPPSRAPC